MRSRRTRPRSAARPVAAPGSPGIGRNRRERIPADPPGGAGGRRPRGRVRDLHCRAGAVVAARGGQGRVLRWDRHVRRRADHRTVGGRAAGAVGHGDPVGAAGRCRVHLASRARSGPLQPGGGHLYRRRARTLVRLTHSGWEIFDDPAAMRAEYDKGWPTVLGYYVDHAARPGEDDGAQTWVALLHRRGPSAPQGSVFGYPRFAEHVAFLNRMREAGYLIAAGPLADEDGAGMTILRLPGADRLGHATNLPTKDDARSPAGCSALPS